MKRRLGGIDLWVEHGGSGSPALLLAHGLGCTGEVWRGLVEILARSWPGSWIIPDLRGHGRSDHAELYGIAMYAADMAMLLRDVDRAIVCGHSMGGAAGMILASGLYGVEVEHVIAIGTKMNWSAEEVAGAHKVAAAPVRWFDHRADAVDRFLRVSGLAGLVDPGSPVAASGIHEQDGRFRLAADMRVNLVAGAYTKEAHRLARARTKVTLASGELDAMSTVSQLRALDPDAVELRGAGHNAHFEDPDAVWRLIASAAGL